jgi:hypothetical protein
LWASSWWSCELNSKIKSLEGEFWPPTPHCLQVLRTSVPEPFQVLSGEFSRLRPFLS